MSQDIELTAAEARKQMLPCPFCGGSDIRITNHGAIGRGPWHQEDSVFSMCCYKCGAQFPNCYRAALFVEKWNRRAAAPEVTRDSQAVAPVAFGDKTAANFVVALKITEGVLDDSRKSHPKWWKRMDGTPILNGMAVFMAEAIVNAVLADRQREATSTRSAEPAVAYGLGKLATHWPDGSAINRASEATPPAHDSEAT